MSYKVHFFVCTNGPDREGRCGHKNSEALRAQLKETTHKMGLKGIVRVNSSGCLGHCEQGIACVMYPQNKWYLNQTDTRAPELALEIEQALKAIEKNKEN
jgi:(2Fe-2S) ferredoxin